MRIPAATDAGSTRNPACGLSTCNEASPALLNKWGAKWRAPRTDQPLTHFASPESGHLTSTILTTSGGTRPIFRSPLVLNTLDGSGIGTGLPKHTHQQWLQFLRLIKRQTPHDKQIHLIVDNYATHKHAEVKRWLQRNKRFHVHFTPTSASWLNMVERFFRDLTNKRIRRGVFRSVKELTTAIEDYIAQHNQQPKPFIWTAKASDIFEKVKRGRAALHKLQSA